MSGPRDEIAFEPVRLGHGRRGPGGATAIGALIAVLLVVAIAKPWELVEPPSGVPAEAASASPVVADQVIPVASDAPSLAPPPWVARPADPAGWRADPAPLLAALSPHDSWGVRAVVAVDDGNGGIRPAERRLVERWTPVTPPLPGTVSGDSAGDGLVADAVVLPGDGLVRAVGITSPPAWTPLDLRVWWLRGHHVPQRLEVRAVDAGLGAGHLLLLPPRAADGRADVWPPGSYRFDMLVDGHVARLAVLVPHGRGPVRGPVRGMPDPFALPDDGPSDPGTPWAEQLAMLPVGPFVVSGGSVVPLAAPVPGALDDAEAWLDPRERRGRRASAVTRVHLADVEALGIVLPSGLPAREIRFTRLAPIPFVTPLEFEVARRFDRIDRYEAATFRPVDGSDWAAGTYGFGIDWRERGGPRSATWHVELLPAAPRRDRSWAGAVRAWERHAGRWGFVTGTAEPLEGGPSGVAIRWLRQAPGSAPTDIQALGDDCRGGALVDRGLPMVGLTHPAGRTVEAVDAARLLPDGSERPVALSVARNAVPGLSIVGPPAGERWAQGHYRLDVRHDAGTSRLVLCVGEVRRGYARVDAAATDH